MNAKSSSPSLSQLLSELRDASPANSARLSELVAERLRADSRAHLRADAGSDDESQLARVLERMLSFVIDAVEARHLYFRGHSRRVALLSTLIAKEAGLSDAETSRVHIGALLHDVGMSHPVFAPLMEKMGRLTPEEWQTIKTHPDIGAELLREVPTLRDLVPVVRHHHENWDGTGYPAGLSGEQIPLGSRIVMLAQAFDAMTTDRPYRRALAIDQVQNELTRVSSQQIDPGLVELVLRDELMATLVDVQRRMVLDIGPAGLGAQRDPGQTEKTAGGR